jgi:hypothetical protein
MVAIDVLVALTLWKRKSRIIFLGMLKFQSSHIIIFEQGSMEEFNLEVGMPKCLERGRP